MGEYPQLRDALRETRATACLECGKCTANCPVTRYNGGFSPRRVMTRAVAGEHEGLLGDASVWQCLTCGMCETRCPADIEFSRMLQRVRSIAVPAGASLPACTHGGTLHALMRMMANPDLEPDRMGWVTDDMEIGEEGEVLLWVGCAPFFTVYFEYLGVSSVDITRGAVRILNRAGITPVVMSNERCCGHDLLWTGDDDSFRALAELNLAAIRETGAKTVIAPCAECYRTLSHEYAKMDGGAGWEVRHMSEFIAGALADGTIELEDRAERVTFHDPCRLGRQSGVVDSPRDVLAGIDGLDVVEMARSRERSLCCGTGSWINCDSTSKSIQAERLSSAKSTGADVLLTACPKCAIHFNCALQDRALADQASIEIRDLTVYAAEALREG